MYPARGRLGPSVILSEAKDLRSSAEVNAYCGRPAPFVILSEAKDLRTAPRRDDNSAEANAYGGRSYL